MPAKPLKRHFIGQLRRELGATQPQLARRLGVSLTTLQKIEGGRMAVSPRTAYALSHHTGIARRHFVANQLPPALDMDAVKARYQKRMGTTAECREVYESIHLAPRVVLFHKLLLHLAVAEELGGFGCETSGFYKILERASESLLRCIGDAYLRRGIYNKVQAVMEQGGLDALLTAVQKEVSELRRTFKSKEK